MSAAPLHLGQARTNEGKSCAELGRGDRQALATLLASGRNDLAPALGLHSGPKPVCFLAMAVAGSICALHGYGVLTPRRGPMCLDGEASTVGERANVRQAGTLHRGGAKPRAIDFAKPCIHPAFQSTPGDPHSLRQMLLTEPECTEQSRGRPGRSKPEPGSRCLITYSFHHCLSRRGAGLIGVPWSHRPVDLLYPFADRARGRQGVRGSVFYEAVSLPMSAASRRARLPITRFPMTSTASRG